MRFLVLALSLSFALAGSARGADSGERGADVAVSMGLDDQGHGVVRADGVAGTILQQELLSLQLADGLPVQSSVDGIS